MQTRQISIETEYITLGQLLKLADLVETGGQVKDFLQQERVLLNGEETSSRGKKIFPGDFVKITGEDVNLEIISEAGPSKE